MALNCGGEGEAMKNKWLSAVACLFHSTHKLPICSTSKEITKSMKMNKIKFNALLVLFLTMLTKGEVTKEEIRQNLYSLIPQTYYVPQAFTRYVSPSQKLDSPSDNQIPASVTSTEKSHLIPSYKIAVNTPKYTAAIVAKPQQTYSNQNSYPYLYTLAKFVPSTTAATYTQAILKSNDKYYEDVPKKYHYGYRVSNALTGTEFGHSEVNDGHSAKGYYHVLLPDGRLQNVKYWAGPSGYHATITYESKY